MKVRDQPAQLQFSQRCPANNVMPAKLLNAAMQNACQGGGTPLAHLSRSAVKAARQLLLALCSEMYVVLTVCVVFGLCDCLDVTLQSVCVLLQMLS